MPYIELEEWKQKMKKGECVEQPILRKQFSIEVKGIEDTKDGLKVPFVISTPVVDRDNDSIDVNGWKLENYRKNPVVLWVHDGRQPPVAKSLEETVDGEKLKSTALFATKDLYPFGHMIGQMYAQGFLNAVSVGFDPIKYAWIEDPLRPWGIDYKEQDLLEYSCCPVPCNPEALVDAKSKGIDMEPMLDWVVGVLDNGLYVPRTVAEKIYKTLSTKSTFIIPKSNDNHNDNQKKDIKGKQNDKEDEEKPAKKSWVSFYEQQIKINNNWG